MCKNTETCNIVRLFDFIFHVFQQILNMKLGDLGYLNTRSDQTKKGYIGGTPI